MSVQVGSVEKSVGQSRAGRPANACGTTAQETARRFEPTRKKLTTLETQRIMAVLVDCSRRVELLTLLPHLLRRLEDFQIVLGRQLTDLLQRHAELSDRFDLVKAKLDIALDRAPPEPPKETQLTEDFWDQEVEEDEAAAVPKVEESRVELLAQVEALQAEEAELLPQVQFSTRLVLRAFRNNPAAATAVLQAQKLKKLQQQQQPQQLQLMDRMTRMRDIMALRLMTTPGEKQDKLTYLHEMSERERQNASAIAKLEAELQAATAEKDAMVKAKNDVIRKIQADIHNVEKYAEETIKAIRAEAEKQQQTDQKNSQGKTHKLLQERNLLKTQLDNLVAEHREAEQLLRSKKFKLESEIEDIIRKYDAEMGERQESYEEIDEAYTEEKKQLYELQERFKTLEEEYKQIMEERRIAEEKRQAAEREMQLMISAATTIQSFWRSFKVRKTLRGKKKKGGGGKKKK